MPSSSPASIIDSSRLSQRLKTPRNFSILRSCSHVARFIDSPPTRRHRTGQLVCYLSRTTHELTTYIRADIDPGHRPESYYFYGTFQEEGDHHRIGPGRRSPALTGRP